VLPSTPFDRKLDRESINPGYQAFEKFISGMYLGEIARNLILSLVDSVPATLFGGKSTPTLNGHYGFDTSYMSAIEEAGSVSDIKAVLVDRLGFEPESVTDEDAEIVRICCEVVATRAASLSACAVAAVLIQTGKAKLGGKTCNDEKVYKVGLDGR
jgi:hexokinase